MTKRVTKEYVVGGKVYTITETLERIRNLDAAYELYQAKIVPTHKRVAETVGKSPSVNAGSFYGTGAGVVDAMKSDLGATTTPTTTTTTTTSTATSRVRLTVVEERIIAAIKAAPPEAREAVATALAAGFDHAVVERCLAVVAGHDLTAWAKQQVERLAAGAPTASFVFAGKRYNVVCKFSFEVVSIPANDAPTSGT